MVRPRPKTFQIVLVSLRQLHKHCIQHFSSRSGFQLLIKKHFTFFPRKANQAVQGGVTIN